MKLRLPLPLVLLLASATLAAGPASRPVSPVERLRAQLFLAERPADQDVGPRMDFAGLAAEADAYPEADERVRAGNTIELWRQIVRLHDAARRTSPEEFVRGAAALLRGDEKTGRVAGTTLESVDACKLLMERELPEWAFRVRWCAAAVLAARGHDTLAPLVDAFRRTVAPAGFKRGLTECLVISATAEAAPAWSKVAGDKDLHVRSWAIEALGRIEPRASGPALRGLLADAEKSVRHRAAWALATADDRAAAPLLREMIDDIAAKDPGSAHHAAWFCGKLQQWREPRVPWDTLDGLFDQQQKPEHLQNLITAAGECMRVANSARAHAFLSRVVSAAAVAVDKPGGLADRDGIRHAVRAACLLLREGHAEGLDFLEVHARLRLGDALLVSEAQAALEAFATEVGRPVAHQPRARRILIAYARAATPKPDAPAASEPAPER